MQKLNFPQIQFTQCNSSQISGRYSDKTFMRPLSFKSAGDVFVKSAETVVQDNFKSDLVQKFVSIFKCKPEDAPHGLDIKTSPMSGQIVGFVKELKHGKKLCVTKQFIHKNCRNYFYISFKEFKNNEIQNAFAVDMEKGDIVKLRQKGNIRFREDDFIRVNPEIPLFQDYCKKLSLYINEIYAESGETSVNVLPTTHPKQRIQHTPRITIDDLLDEDKILDVPEEILPDEYITSANRERKNHHKTKKIQSVKPLQVGIDKQKTSVKGELLSTGLPEKTVKQEKILAQKKTKELKKTAASPKVTSKNRVAEPVKVKTFTNCIDMDSARIANVKPVLIENLKAARHTIDKVPGGALKPDQSKKLFEMEKNLTDLAVLLNDNRGNINKIKDLKSAYEPVEYSANRQKTINFKLPDRNTLGVIHTKTGERYTRIIFKESDGTETHLLVEDRCRVVSNLNKKSPWTVPSKFRYMTEEQINASNIDKYIEFLNKEVAKYYTYLKENL